MEISFSVILIQFLFSLPLCLAHRYTHNVTSSTWSAIQASEQAFFGPGLLISLEFPLNEFFFSSIILPAPSPLGYWVWIISYHKGLSMSAQLCWIHCGGSIGVFLFGSPNFMNFIWVFYYDLLTSKSVNIDHLYHKYSIPSISKCSCHEADPSMMHKLVPIGQMVATLKDYLKNILETHIKTIITQSTGQGRAPLPLSCSRLLCHYPILSCLF